MTWLLLLFTEKAYAANELLNLPTGRLTEGAGTGAAAVANRIVDVLTFLIYPLAFASLVYSAYLLLSSAGNPDAWGKAKKNVTYIVTGVFLAVFAAIFVSFLRRALS